MSDLSIIIPVYNGEKTLDETLAAIFLNKNITFQVIVIDDGSTDRSSDIAMSYQVDLISLENNHGISYARNAGLKKANSKYVAFVDADCIVPADWCETAMATFNKIQEKDPEVVAVSGQVLPYRKKYSDNLAMYIEHWEYFKGKEEKRLKLTTSNCLALLKSIKN